MTTEIVLMWAALTCYVVATALFVFGVTFSKDRLVRSGVYVTALGLVPQLISLGMRWVRVGHGPYIGYYEVANGLTLFVVGFFVIAALRNPRISTAGIAIMPVALLILGGAMLAPKGGLPLSANLASYWLFIHVAFANLAFAAFVASFGLAIAFIIRDRSAGGKWSKRLERLPSQTSVEDLMTRFVLAGFIFWGVMIVSGAIWANEAWGRYWSWDPIETWSLIVWIIYAVYLHLRFTLRWRGERLAWYAIASMPVALFCLIGIPTVFHTIHGGYIGGTDG
jgi:cytochrome c-type biogenesis protein CcsB